jgi:hypothetical protein
LRRAPTAHLRVSDADDSEYGSGNEGQATSKSQHTKVIIQS